jgi:hypothetical protein
MTKDSLNSNSRRLSRQIFNVVVGTDFRDANDLLFAVAGEMSERITGNEIAATRFDNDDFRMELAFVIFQAWQSAHDTLTFEEREVLIATIRALTDADAPTRLVLKFNRRGRKRSPVAEWIDFEKDRKISAWLQARVDAGDKLESAVAEAVKHFSTNRSAVFDAWAGRTMHRRRDESANSIVPSYHWAQEEPEPEPVQDSQGRGILGYLRTIFHDYSR